MWVNSSKYKAVGRVLAEVRKRQTLDQTELARRIGQSQSFVSKLEQGRRRINILEVQIIAAGLGVTAEKLFAEVTEKVPVKVRKKRRK